MSFLKPTTANPNRTSIFQVLSACLLLALLICSSIYYFSAAYRLGRGDVYSSPAALNIGHNRNEIPHKLILPIARTAFGRHGKNRDILVFSFIGAERLKSFHKTAAVIADHALLLDKDGRQPISHKPGKASDLMLASDLQILTRSVSDAWQHSLSANRERFMDCSKLQTVGPLDTGMEEQQTIRQTMPKEGASFWQEVAHLPPEEFSSNLFLLKFLLAALTALLFIQLAARWKLARIRPSQGKTQDQLRYTNRHLERLVEERTAELKADIDFRKQVEEQLLIQSAALESAANAIVITDDDAVIQWANPAFSTMTGYSLEEAIGRHPKDLLKSGLQSQSFYQAMWDTIRNGRIWRGEVINKRKDGVFYTEAMTITPVRNTQGEIRHFIAVKEDISKRKQMEQRQLAQFRLLDKATGDMPLTALLEEMIRFIEEQAPGLRCSILLADEAHGVLRHGAAPSLPSSYNRLVDGLPISEGSGSCGTACALRRAVIVSDVRSNPLWAAFLPKISDQDWLRACWSTPFFDSNCSLLGTFGIYAAEPRTPNTDESELIAYAVTLASLLVERKRANEALRQSENKLATILDSVEAAIYIKDTDLCYQYANRHVCELFGRSLTEITGQRDEVFFDTDTAARLNQNDLRVLKHGERIEVEENNTSKESGQTRAYLSVKLPLKNEDGEIYALCGISTDITEHKKAESRLINLNRVYTVLSNINQAIVRLRDMDMVFGEACRIAVEDGGFRMAWISLPDLASGMLRPVAQCGMTRNYLTNICISLNEDERGNGPTGIAFREGRPVFCNDIEHDSCMAPWKHRALELGYHSSVAMPIKVKEEVRGVFNLYAGKVDFFNDKEIRLLDELANDIGFAMEVAETEAEQRQASERLRQAAVVFESTREGVMVTDAEQSICLVNRAFSEITGYTEAEVLGKTPAVLSSGHHNRDFHAELWASINATGHWQGEVWNRRKNGEVFPELLSISVVQDESGQLNGYVGVFADISKLKEAESEMEFLAHHDPLTRLPNRLLLLSSLDHGIEMALRNHRQLALLMLDLDRFKDINDSFGHLTGDELLQQTAVRLTERLRGADIVARLGGDEFSVLLEDIAHPEDAARVAEELIAVLSEPWHLKNGIEARIGVSIGISLFPQHGNSAEELLQQADAALYQAKAAGRGRFLYFSETMTQAARERIELEARLRRAIILNELRVYYQPQVDIASGRIIGAEALVRWQDPVEGLIAPNRFIPVAEATGLINAVGEWVLKETCMQGQRWNEAGLPPLMLAVNVSPHQFLNNDLSTVVANVLAATGFPADRLELELTESALMERQHEAADMLYRLQMIGVRLAIDDFGTGYSSLAYLKRFPLDVLKIDKSFVDDIPDSQDGREIAAAIVAMAHTLRYKVLAEGVETAEQLAFLQSQGCDFYQGYLKSPPLPPEAFAKLLI